MKRVETIWDEAWEEDGREKGKAYGSRVGWLEIEKD